MKMKKIAVLGAGAVGSYVIWGLSKRDDISLGVVAEGERANRLKNGCIINGVTYHPEVWTPQEAQGADLLIILSDINGLYSADPRTDTNAQVIREVRKIDARIEQMAGGAGSALGSGGMATKINAAKIATEAGVDMVIMNGRDPEQLYALFDGEPIGTHFLAE